MWVSAKRVFVLGLDALSPKLLQRFVREGFLPNFKRLMEIGGFSKALPILPAQTPENWTSIATGAYPGTHGIAVWGRHDEGQPVTQHFPDEAMSSNLCLAEYLWEAAARHGLRSVLLYFIGYPRTTDGAVHVDWFFTPTAYYFEICSAACYSSFDEPTIRTSHRVYKVSFREADGWSNLPDLKPTPLECRLIVEPNMGGVGAAYYALIIGSGGEGYDRCIIARDKDFSKPLCTLSVGEWSRWIRQEFIVNDRRLTGTVRFKLLALSVDGERFRLYRSQVYPISGFSDPPEVSSDLVERFGPYVNEAVGALYLNGLVDERTFVEEITYQIDWVRRAAEYLMDRFDASIYMMHWHFIDMLQHKCLSLIDPSGGDYDPAGSEDAMRMVRLGYQMADRLVGRFMELLDDRTYLIVVSDHGNVPNRKVYPLLKVLADEGLVELRREGGDISADWSKSKIFIDQTNIYVNLKGRYACGVVDDSEYEEIRDRVIRVFRELKDEDGEYVFSLVLRREEAAMLGLWGNRVGDIIYAYSPTFTWSHSKYENPARIVGGAHHGPKPPTAETSISSNYAVFMIAGPGVKRGYVRPVNFLGPVFLVDIAPTIAHILGFPPPRHSQGRVLYDFFDGWEVSEMRRERRDLRQCYKQPVRIKGDVTEQILK